MFIKLFKSDQAIKIQEFLVSILASGILILTTQSCTTTRYKHVDDLSAKGECENASTKFITSQHGANFGESIQTTTGKVSSYGLGTIGYTADTVIVGSGPTHDSGAPGQGSAAAIGVGFAAHS